jgi:hypothetical protein
MELRYGAGASLAMRADVSGCLCVTETPDAVSKIKFFSAVNADQRLICDPEKLVAAHLTVGGVFSIFMAASAIHLYSRGRF